VVDDEDESSESSNEDKKKVRAGSQKLISRREHTEQNPVSEAKSVVKV
jgi:hypothetical protein